MKPILVLIVFLLPSCSSNIDNRKYLVDESCSKMSNNNLNKVLLSSYFKSNIILIEPTKDIVIGKINKIIKKDSIIYFLNDYKSIAIFNKYGKYICNISKQGHGPSEYNEILDFDVFNKHIFILSYKKIYEYDSDGNFIRKINLEFIANKFKYTEHGILFQSSMYDKVLVSTDINGKITNTYLKRDLTNRLTRDIPFTTISDCELLYQIGYSNDIIIYNYKTMHFSNSKIIKKSNALSHHGYEKLLALFGDEADRKINRHVYFDGISCYQNYLLFPYINNDKVNLIVFDMLSKNYLDLSINKDHNIIDDISFTDPFFLQNLALTDSDDSFLTYVYAHKIKEGIRNFSALFPEYSKNENYLHMMNIIGMIQDDNSPILIELKL